MRTASDGIETPLSSSSVSGLSGASRPHVSERSLAAFSRVRPATAVALVIAAIALFLRLAYLGKQSLWLDEVSTWAFTRKFATCLNPEPQSPPVYYLIQFFWLKLAGVSEVALRLPSVVCSMVALFITYKFAARVFGQTVALIALGYGAISTFQIYYAQEARCHALLLAEIMALSWLWWRAMEERDRRHVTRLLAMYAVLAALAMYTHLMAIFFIAAHGLFALWKQPKRWLHWSAAIGAAVLMFSAWIIYVMRLLQAGVGQPRRFLLLKLPQTFFSLLFGDSLIPLDNAATRDVTGTLLDNWWILALSLGALAVLALFCVRALKRHPLGMQFAIMMGFAPTAMCFLVSFRDFILDERYMLSSSPFLFMVLAAGAREVFVRGIWSGRVRALGIGALAVYGVLLALSLTQYYFVPRFEKDDWRDMTGYIENQAAGNDTVVFDPDFIEDCYRYYQKRDLHTVRIMPALTADAGWARRIAASSPRVWVVRSYTNSDEALRAFAAVYPRNSIQVFPTGMGIEVYSFY